MRKGKSHKARKARRGAVANSVEVASAKLPLSSPDGSTKPPGQRLYDMPYSATAPRMINPGIGLHNLVARAGHNAAYEIDVTLLDAPDYRLTRSGFCSPIGCWTVAVSGSSPPRSGNRCCPRTGSRPWGTQTSRKSSET